MQSRGSDAAGGVAKISEGRLVVREEPDLIKGAMFVDDRGSISFVNDFDLAKMRRFYVVENHEAGFIRAWHCHVEESKYVMALSGTAILALVYVEDPENPPIDPEIHRYVLTSSDPTVLWIPPGYAHGAKTLSPDTKLIFFSDASLAESQKDDFRFDAFQWDPWSVVPR